MVSISSRRLSLLTWGHVGHITSHPVVHGEPREGHVLQMVLFRWFYKHFQRETCGCMGAKESWACRNRVDMGCRGDEIMLYLHPVTT